MFPDALLLMHSGNNLRWAISLLMLSYWCIATTIHVGVMELDNLSAKYLEELLGVRLILKSSMDEVVPDKQLDITVINKLRRFTWSFQFPHLTYSPRQIIWLKLKMQPARTRWHTHQSGRYHLISPPFVGPYEAGVLNAPFDSTSGLSFTVPYGGNDLSGLCSNSYHSYFWALWWCVVDSLDIHVTGNMAKLIWVVFYCCCRGGTSPIFQSFDLLDLAII